MICGDQHKSALYYRNPLGRYHPISVHWRFILHILRRARDRFYWAFAFLLAACG